MQFYDCEDTQWTLSPVPSHITAWSSDAEPLLPTDAVLGYTAHLDEPNTRKLEELVDAYFFRESENMRRLPKLVVNGGNDEFFLPDDTKVWWRGLPGEKSPPHGPERRPRLAVLRTGDVSQSSCVVGAICRDPMPHLSQVFCVV